MHPFEILRTADPGEAVALLAASPGAKLIAGGTNLVDLMKEGVETPARLIDIRRMGLADIQEIDEGVRLGALASNTAVANHPLVRRTFPALTEALLSGASQQLRNAATLGGNLMQRVRCPYFTDTAHARCNKRKPGSGCSAQTGYQHYHAILGLDETRPACIAVNPSDMAVALAALDGVVRVLGPGGERTIPMTEFHRLPDGNPTAETTLGDGELILSVDLPASAFARRSHYLKVRERASYAFALVSAAVAVGLSPEGVVQEARVVLGGVAHKPWRSEAAESELVGGSLRDKPRLHRAAEAALTGARVLLGNGYKVGLAKDTLVRALSVLGSE